MFTKLTFSAVLFCLSLAVGAQPATAGQQHGSRVAAMGPIANIAPRLQRIFTCIIFRESRSTWTMMHLDVSKTGSSGIFQFENGPHQVWSRWAPLVGVRVPVWKATVLQQEQVAVEVYRHDGFSPWRDGCYD